jgi:TM2 domain-containing membrane protein YozV
MFIQGNLLQKFCLIALFLGIDVMITFCGRKNYAYFSASRAGHSAVENTIPNDVDSLVAKINTRQSTITSFDTSILEYNPLSILTSIKKDNISKATLRSELGNAKIGKLLKADTRTQAISKKTSSGGERRSLAAALCLFLGIFGAHRFYLDYKWQGCLQLFLCLLGLLCLPIAGLVAYFGGAFFFDVIIWLLPAAGLLTWTFIDFIRILAGTLEPKGGPYADE